MPRRTGLKCKPRTTQQLDLISELALVMWEPMIPGTGFPNTKQLRNAWEQHGPRILPHYIKCRPGTRPAAVYYLGIVPLPDVTNPPRVWDAVQIWGGKQYFPAWRYFGSATGSDDHFHSGVSWGECEYLHQLGVLLPGEYEIAQEWCDDRYYSPGAETKRYEPLSKDTLGTPSGEDDG